MYPTSKDWASAVVGRLAPEGFVEISMHIPDLQEVFVYTKNDILSFTHHQSGSLISAELPKNSIEFTLNNIEGRWDPSNPTGKYGYLSDRLKVTIRYGFDLSGVTEWIPGGVFYLSQWSLSSNGLSTSFVARDVLEFMMNQPYTGEIYGTLYELASMAIAETSLPEDAVISLCDDLKNYSVAEIEYYGGESVAEILQKCANAACCVMYQNRAGVLVVERLSHADSGFVVEKEFMYSYPEVELSRPLRAVTVTYGVNNIGTYIFATAGETQTLTNELISGGSQAAEVAAWICENLRTRQNIRWSLRCDPSLDLFDLVSVENKYGLLTGVILTGIEISFTGAFRASYSGYISTHGVVENIYCGEIYTGEVL